MIGAMRGSATLKLPFPQGTGEKRGKRVEDAYRANWKRLKWLCKSLAKGKLSYTVEYRFVEVKQKAYDPITRRDYDVMVPAMVADIVWRNNIPFSVA
jgi:hypothetical protein